MMEWILLGVLFYDSIEDIYRRRIRVMPNVLAGLTGILLHFMKAPGSIGGLVPGIFIGVLVLFTAIVSKEAIGKGDGLMVIMTGCWLGGVKNLLLLLGACYFAGIFSGIQLILKKAERRTEIPFAPFILIACAGVVML